MEPVGILIVDDSPGYADLLALILSDEGYHVDVASDAAQALARVRERCYDVALVDVRLPDSLGTDLLAEMRRLRPTLDCVVVTAFSSTETAVQAVNEGAYAYLVKPVAASNLLAVIRRVVERRCLMAQNERMLDELRAANQILLTLVDSIDSAILLAGPGGDLHYANRRAREFLGDEAAGRDGDESGTFLGDLLRAGAREGDPGGPAAASEEERRLEIPGQGQRVLRRYRTPMRNEDGSILGWLEVYNDITHEKYLLERERHIAHTLQQSFLPQIPGCIQGLDVAVYYQAAGDDARIGGDFYDVFPVQDHRVAIVVGDVSGKGFGAALDTAMTRYTLRSYAFEDPSPASLLPRLNRLLYRETAPEGFVALSYAVLDPAGRVLHYTSAGHEGPLLWHAATQRITALKAGGAAAGCLPDASYDMESIEWQPGDMLLLFTDGVTEARRGSDFLDMAGLVSLFAEHAGTHSARATVDGIRAGLERFSGGRLRDDVAILAVRMP